MKAPAARESEDRLGDDAAGRGDRVERLFEIVHAHDRQWRRQRIGRLAVEADIGGTVGRRRIIGPVVGELPAERLRVEARVSSWAVALGSST